MGHAVDKCLGAATKSVMDTKGGDKPVVHGQQTIVLPVGNKGTREKNGTHNQAFSFKDAGAQQRYWSGYQFHYTLCDK